MAAQGDDHLLKLLVDCIASRNIAYESMTMKTNTTTTSWNTMTTRISLATLDI